MRPQLNLDRIRAELEGESSTNILTWCYDTFPHESVKIGTSFGAEGMVIMHMCVALIGKPRVFTIDTGRNFQETYDIWQTVQEHYDLTIESYGPAPDDLAELVADGGPNLFYASVENRKRCCYVRKVKPLARALADAQVWITSLRREESASRESTPLISWNKTHQVYKICPLVDWLEGDVWEYIRNNAVPYNKLHDQGYHTIGCCPCTRPVRPAEGKRASRWWWETDQAKECGIHFEGGKAVRTQKNWSI